jgi:hypothetical protein
MLHDHAMKMGTPQPMGFPRRRGSYYFTLNVLVSRKVTEPSSSEAS